MPTIFDHSDGAVAIVFNSAEARIFASNIQQIREWESAFNKAWGRIFHGATRAKNPSSSDKPLAPRKPARSRAKGDTPKARKPPRKGSGKKRGR